MRYTDKLETPRLITRFLTADDVSAWVEYCSDHIATKYTLVRDKTPREMAEWFIHYALERYAQNRLGLQALIAKDTNEFIGMCGLLVQEPGGKTEIEVGYHLLRRFWGKGYATEAAQMFRDYGFEHGDMDSIISIIHPLNGPSQAVAMRNGMRLTETEVEFKGNTYDIYRITRAEWREIIKVS